MIIFKFLVSSDDKWYVLLCNDGVKYCHALSKTDKAVYSDNNFEYMRILNFFFSNLHSNQYLDFYKLLYNEKFHDILGYSLDRFKRLKTYFYGERKYIKSNGFYETIKIEDVISEDCYIDIIYYRKGYKFKVGINLKDIYSDRDRIDNIISNLKSIEYIELKDYDGLDILSEMLNFYSNMLELEYYNLK